MSAGVTRQRLDLGLGYQVNKILNFQIPVSTWLPGLSGSLLVPTALKGSAVESRNESAFSTLQTIEVIKGKQLIARIAYTFFRAVKAIIWKPGFKRTVSIRFAAITEVSHRDCCIHMETSFNSMLTHKVKFKLLF